MPDNGNTLAYKEDFERAQEYWEAFWQGQIIDRPVTVLCADRTDKPVEPARLQPVVSDFEAAVAEFDAYLDTHADSRAAMGDQYRIRLHSRCGT